VDQILRTHLLSLESKLQELHDQLTSPTTPPADLARINLGIQIGQRALEGFRLAIELEQQLSLIESPAKPGRRPPNATLK
jgi:hypothetical protein